MPNAHTPGPWLDEVKAVMDSTGAWVCEVRTQVGRLIARVLGSDKSEVEANARLIAQAPRMVNDIQQALLLAQQALESLSTVDGEPNLPDARGAICGIVDRHRAILRAVKGE